MKTLKVKTLGRVHDPINPLPVTATDQETMKAIINLLREVGMIVGNFKAETLFDFGFEVLKGTLMALHKHLKAVVGEVPPRQSMVRWTRSQVPLQGHSTDRHQGLSMHRPHHQWFQP